MIQWLDESHFMLGGERFKVMVTFADLVTASEKYLLLGKPREMLESMVRNIAFDQVNYLFELGIHRGGSAVFFSEYYKPRKLVTVDLKKDKVRDLEDYIERCDLEAVVKPMYGVDQADRERLASIYEEEFGGKPLDLVVDDASHFLGETRASFNSLFPLLRPGGKYVIEDWGWAHVPDLGSLAELFSTKEPMSVLGFQIMLACARFPGVISEVLIDQYCIYVTRGSVSCPDNFAIERAAGSVNPEMFKEALIAMVESAG